MQFSVTIAGLIVLALTQIFAASGVQIAPESIQATAETLVSLVGIVIAWFGRYRVGDITIAGTRKK